MRNQFEKSDSLSSNSRVIWLGSVEGHLFFGKKMIVNIETVINELLEIDNRKSTIIDVERRMSNID